MVFGRVDEVHEEYSAKGWLPSKMSLRRGLARGILEVVTFCVHQIFLILADQLRQGIPSESDGEWLDCHAGQVEAPRQEKGKARGKVVFGRSGTSGNAPVSKGRIVRTRPDGEGRVHRYVTLEDGVIVNGQSETTVLVESEDYGASANAVPGQICEIVTAIPGIETVTNREGWLVTEGVDKESDPSLLQRYTMQWKGNDGYSASFYEKLARSVPGVVDVKINAEHPRGQGTVDIVVRGMAGIPTDELLEKVREVIDPEAHQNDDWMVLGPTAVGASLSLVLHLLPGAVWEEIQPEVDTAIRGLFVKPDASSDEVFMFGVGEDMTRYRIEGAIARVTAQVKFVEWVAPSGDISVGDSGLITLTELILNHVMAEAA